MPPEGSRRLGAGAPDRGNATAYDAAAGRTPTRWCAWLADRQRRDARRRPQVSRADLEECLPELMAEPPAAQMPAEWRMSALPTVRLLARSRLSNAPGQGDAAVLESQFSRHRGRRADAVLYLLVFGQVLADHVEVFPGVSYVAFLIPGCDDVDAAERVCELVFQLSIEIMGSLVFVCCVRYRTGAFGAYVLASIVRGLVSGLAVFVVAVWFGLRVRGAAVDPGVALRQRHARSARCHRRIWADQSTARGFKFVVMAATFLSGVFYSVRACQRSGRRVAS